MADRSRKQYVYTRRREKDSLPEADTPTPKMVSLGVDVSVSRKLDLIFLDEKRRLVGPPLRAQTSNDLARVLLEKEPDIVAIDSPPHLGIRGGSRLGERDMLRLGIHCYFTPSDRVKAENEFYDWMRVGFTVFRAARSAGYPLFAGGAQIRHRAIEVFPHGSAVALAGCLPPSGTCRSNGRKRRWRVAVLEANGVDTRQLRSMDAVDAALVALTGLMALEGNFWVAGDAVEGVIVLPGRRLVARVKESAVGSFKDRRHDASGLPGGSSWTRPSSTEKRVRT